jgi:hypothetical protein
MALTPSAKDAANFLALAFWIELRRSGRERFGAHHSALSGTRGDVMSLAELDGPDATLTWVGVGNVEAWGHPRHGDGRIRRSFVEERIFQGAPPVVPCSP